MINDQQNSQKPDRDKKPRLEAGYLLVFGIILLSFITIGIAVSVYKKSQEVKKADVVLFEVKNLPLTGDITPTKDLQFTCDKYSEGKLQIIDGIQSRCIDSMWIKVAD